MTILIKTPPTTRRAILINLALNRARGSGNRAIRRMEMDLRIDHQEITRARSIIAHPV